MGKSDRLLALQLIDEHGLSSDAYEFQMLYGMAECLQSALVEMGQPLRIYTPVGAVVPGMAYLVRRLLENSANASLLRYALLDEQPRESKEPPVRPAAAPDYPPAFCNEPLYRFSNKAKRLAVSRAIAAARTTLGGHEPIRINGREIDTGERIISVNPSRPQEIVGTVAAATQEVAEKAIAAATTALPDWSGLTVGERAAILRRAAALLRERRDEFVALEVLEAGKPWGEADADVCEAIDFLRYYSEQAELLGTDADFNVAGESNRYEYRPCGVATVIPPWNFPLAIPTGMIAAALVTGNTVILKPSSETPVIAARLVSLLHDAGLPAGALNYLPGSGVVIGEYLVTHPGIHLIAFTGSLDVGLRIHELAAGQSRRHGHIKRVIAEMGGKNAIIIDDDADADAAVAGVIASAFGYAGQKCSACSRVIIVGHGYDALVERLRAAADSLLIGSAEQPETLLGPVISATAQQRIKNVIGRVRQQARAILIKQIEDADGGYYVGPALFADVDPDDALAQEEIFGPVLSILRATDFNEAIRITNNSCYALTGGLYSRNPEHLERARHELEVGNLYLNRGITGAIVGRQPFGGFKLSGMGHKAGGPDYLLQFLQARLICENTMRRGFTPSGDSADERST
jgi:RHH-type proline utilization regulon transcriptional repressor/proline dehydrogenase/delta 1-pyrroline-5-carboxylate dehydrogenase